MIDQVTAAAKSTSTIGLVAAYSFGEGAGTSVTDASGNGNTGTIANATWTTAGKYGNALVFNGTSSLVTINDSPSLDLTTGMTLEAWVNPSAVSSNWGDVIYKGNDNYFLEGTSAPSGVPGAGGTFGGSDVVTLGTASLPTNTWSYLAATYDGATLRLYVNGILVSSLAQTGNIATSSNPLQIGGDSIFGQYFAGLIDEVRVYNGPLSVAQIQTDMNTPIDTGPMVTSVAPLTGATGVANTTAVTATFNESVLGSSITTSNFVLKDPNGNTIAATVGYSDSNSTATLTPGRRWRRRPPTPPRSAA